MLDCKEVRPRLSEYLAGSLEALKTAVKEGISK